MDKLLSKIWKQNKSIFSKNYKDSKKLFLLSEHDLKIYLTKENVNIQNWVKANNFSAKPGTILPVPEKDLKVISYFVGINKTFDFWSLAKIKKLLPPGYYIIDESLLSRRDEILSKKEFQAIVWALENYRFKPFSSKPLIEKEIKNDEIKTANLFVNDKTLNKVSSTIEGIYLARNLINLPANILGPNAMENIAKELANEHKAKIQVIKGKLIEKNYPAIYNVGKAASESPRLIDIKWIKDNIFPNITIVGKGITFDTGGLDLKPSKAMEIMKKDMGGAAISLGLAHAIMASNLNINLRVLLPVAENSVSSNSMRPLDVIKTARGIDVEIGNTDAEGRLVLADAFHEAHKGKIDLLIDFATLTGAARVALGSELPAMFANNNKTAKGLIRSGEEVNDPLWRLPLYKEYDRFMVKENGALSSIGSSAYGGALTASLFLSNFVSKDTNWVHIDVMAWNLAGLPGRPQGGEAMSLRAVYHYIKSLADKN